MKQQLKKLTAVVSAAAVVTVGGIIGLSALAEGDGLQTELDISQGSITISDGSVSGYDSSGTEVTTTDPDGYIITGTTEEYTVMVSGTQNITLNGVNIDVSSINNTAAFKIEDDSTGNVTITLADGSENTLKSGSGFAGLQKNGDYISADKGKLTITGNTGTLTANGGFNGAGIGGDSGKGSNITISGGTVKATGGDEAAGIGGGDGGSHITISGGTVTAIGGWEAAGIGGGDNRSGSNITISGGTVIANGGSSGAGIGGGNDASGSNITISGGSVKAVAGSEANAIGGGKDGNGAVTPTNGTNEVYLLEIDNDSGEAITIDGKTYPTSHNGEKKIYAYLTGETHIIKVGENTYLRKFDSANKKFVAPDLTITGEVVYGTDYTLVNDTFTIKTEKPSP